MTRLIAAIAALALLLLGLSGAHAFENTFRAIVEPERLWQCGDGFYANGGSDTYRNIAVAIDGIEVGGFDLAVPSECSKVIDHVVEALPDRLIDVQITVGPYTFPSAVHTADRNRIWTVRVFVDSAWSQLTTDYAPPREPASSSEPTGGKHVNTIQLRVVPERQWQCGNEFYATGGSDTYRFGHISVDDETVPEYDFASEQDCGRVESVTRMLADGETSTITATVGSNTMSVDIKARDWERTWWVNFFVDQLFGEIAEGSR